MKMKTIKLSITQGSFFMGKWYKRYKSYICSKSINGRFNIAWVPDANIQNRYIEFKNGIKYPGNEHMELLVVIHMIYQVQ